MKGRPIKSGDVGAGAHGTRVHPASMKGRPIKSGDLADNLASLPLKMPR